MSKGCDGKISPKSVMHGDIIEFYDCMENPDEPSETPHVGLVVDIKENASEIMGYRVLPILERPKNEYIKANEEFFQVTNRCDIDEYMGLNVEHNYRVYYSELTVANNAEHVSAPDDPKKTKGVRRLGSIQGLDLFGQILSHRSNDITQGLGLAGSQGRMANIEIYQMAAQGENMYTARARQDHHQDADKPPSLPSLEET